ncbi:hypothetical protein COLO4_13727 [Corchorus olitorius]|uniref:Uncharacterized protein n=1 Tax=Corchorus olitorius TaxID=93759 RepID=A0A1R3JVD1_9ROSI|nr:hypothetical protein COLO4_13727 [Corchorus olitorius]
MPLGDFENGSLYISLMVDKVKEFRVHHVFREANCEADELAKAGVDRIVPLIASFD